MKRGRNRWFVQRRRVWDRRDPCRTYWSATARDSLPAEAQCYSVVVAATARYYSAVTGIYYCSDDSDIGLRWVV